MAKKKKSPPRPGGERAIHEVNDRPGEDKGIVVDGGKAGKKRRTTQGSKRPGA